MKKMFEILVSDNCCHETDLLSSAIKREALLCGGVFASDEFGGRIRIAVAVSEKLKDYFLARVKDEIADYIAVEYKYEFFMKNLEFSSLENNEKVAFCSALAVFDKATDKKYILEHLLLGSEIVIDSAVAFCMPKLFDRWTEIASLIDANKFELSNGNGLIEMMRFLLKSSPNESEKINLESSNDMLVISNDIGKTKFLYPDCAESDSKVLHRIISLLPRQVMVHGKRFDFLYPLFPNVKKQETEIIV